MTTEQFTYWLQGFFEISDNKKLNEKQVQIIKDHLALVFTKVTPDRNEDMGTTKTPKSLLIDSSEKTTASIFPRDSKAWDLGVPNTGGAICSAETPKHKRGFGGNQGPIVYC